MTIKSQQRRRGESGHPPTVRGEPPKTVKALLGNIERGVGAVVLATPLKVPLRIFQQIVDEHRAGKKSRI